MLNPTLQQLKEQLVAVDISVNMSRVLKIETNKDGIIDAYLKIWNGGIKLTDKEFDITKEYIRMYIDYTEGGVKEPYLSEMLFSSANTKRIKDKLNISKQNWNNYKTTLLTKKIFLIQGDLVQINPLIIPQDELTFKFIRNDIR